MSESNPKRWEPGDNVTYKSRGVCRNLDGSLGSYFWGGDDHGGFVGTIHSYSEWVASRGCWKMEVSSRNGWTYTMIESEFEEWDSSPLPKWKEGDKVEIKSHAECGGEYEYGGADYGKTIGTITGYREYVKARHAYKIRVRFTGRTGSEYVFAFLESEVRTPTLKEDQSVSRDPEPRWSSGLTEFRSEITKAVAETSSKSPVVILKTRKKIKI